MSVSADLAHEGVTRAPSRARKSAPKPPRRGWATAVGLLVVTVLILIAVVPFAASTHVVRMSTSHLTAPTDAILVLGTAQFNGTPSPVFANRLDHAKDLYTQGVAPVVITVGGNQPGDLFTEAEAGRMYLEDAGVPAESIIEVPTGEDTLTSLTAVAEVMADRDFATVTMVSDPAHMARSLAIADRLGMVAQPNGTNAGDGTTVTAEYVARETVGYLYFVFVEQWPVARILPSQLG